MSQKTRLLVAALTCTIFLALTAPAHMRASEALPSPSVLPYVRVAFDESHSPVKRVSDEYSDFYSYLQKLGYITTQIPDATTITPAVLEPIDVLVIAVPLSSYTVEEVDAIESWVNNGGRLLLISDWDGYAEVPSTIAERFDVVLTKNMLHDSDNYITHDYWIYFNGTNLSSELEREGIKYVEVYAIDGIESAPENEIPLITTDTDDTTTWSNGTVASGISVMSAFDGGNVGSGRMIVVCDCGLWDSSEDVDGDMVMNFYEGSNGLLALESIKWLSEPSTKPRPNILAYVEYADYFGEYVNSIIAITNTFEPVYPYLTELWNYTDLEFMLTGVDILFVPEQEHADPHNLTQIGEDWQATLEDFVAQGGILVICDYSWSVPRTCNILTGANLMQISGVRDITWQTVYLGDPFDPLAKYVSSSFTAPDGASSYMTEEENIVFNDGMFPVVIHKTIGMGQAVLIGFDYYELEWNAMQILGNTMELAFYLKTDISPSQASYGTEVTVTGREAAENGTVEIYWDSQLVSSVEANNEGRFTYQLTVPQTIVGEHQIKAVDVETGETSTKTFTVLEPLEVQIEGGATYQQGETAEFYIQTLWMSNPLDAAVVTTLYKPGGSTETLSTQHITVGLYKVTYAVTDATANGTYLLLVKATHTASATSLSGTMTKSFTVSHAVQDMQEQMNSLEQENQALRELLDSLKGQSDNLTNLLYVAIVFALIAAVAAIVAVIIARQKPKTTNPSTSSLSPQPASS